MASMDTIKRRAFGYIRVSTEEQSYGGSPDAQRRAIQQYADNNCIEIVQDGWYEDHASGKNAKRPDLQRMLKRIESERGSVDCVIIFNSTRISRNLLTFYGEIIAPLRKNGVQLLSATEHYGDENDPMGDVAMVLGVMTGEIDNKQKSISTRSSMRSLFTEEGWWMGGRTPLGFKVKRVPVEGKQCDGHQKSHAILVPDNANGVADKITFLLNRFSEGDLKPSDLLELAQKMDIRGYKGDILSQSTLDTILTNEIYAGWHKSKRMNGGEPVKMNFDGIISKETFEKNQRILRSDGPRPHEESDNALYPLHKTICCAICGAEMTDEAREAKMAKGKLPYLRSSAPTSGSGKRTPRYSCKCKGHGSALASEVHQIFEDYLKQITPEEGTIKLFKEIVKRTALKKLGNINNEIERHEQKRAELSTKKQKAIAAMLDGDISKEEKEEYVLGLNVERNKVENELDKLKQAQMLREADIEYVCNFMRDPAKLWRDGDLEIKQAIQRMIFPNGIYFDLKNKKCGTSEISPLFSVMDIKKAPSGANLNALGWDIGIEPTTFWTTIRRSNHLS